MSSVPPHRAPLPEPSGGSAAVGPTCRDLVARLLDYLEDALDADTRAALAQHLEGCPPCRAYARTYDRSRALVGAVTRDATSAALKTRLREFLADRLRSGRG